MHRRGFFKGLLAAAFVPLVPLATLIEDKTGWVIWQSKFKWNAKVSGADWQYVVRIANIDLSHREVSDAA